MRRSPAGRRTPSGSPPACGAAAEVANMTILRTELALAEAVAHRELGDRERALPVLAALADAPAETMLYCRILATWSWPRRASTRATSTPPDAVFGQAEALIETESFGPGGRNWLARVGTQLALFAGEHRRRPALGRPGRRSLLGRDQHRSGPPGRGQPGRCPRGVGAGWCPAAYATRSCSDSSGPAPWPITTSRRSTPSPPSSWRRPTACCRRWPPKARRRSSSSNAQRGACRRSGWTACGERRRKARRPLRGGPTDLVEPLTERECDVLRFLASRLTVREIADELYLSINTLKFHLKAIYRKLGVNSRAEAAEAARRMSLGRPPS